jgi:hypothetical protein
VHDTNTGLTAFSAGRVSTLELVLRSRLRLHDHPGGIDRRVGAAQQLAATAALIVAMRLAEHQLDNRASVAETHP